MLWKRGGGLPPAVGLTAAGGCGCDALRALSPSRPSLQSPACNDPPQIARRPVCGGEVEPAGQPRLYLSPRSPTDRMKPRTPSRANGSNLRLAADIGGTFTDIAVFDDR